MTFTMNRAKFASGVLTAATLAVGTIAIYAVVAKSDTPIGASPETLPQEQLPFDAASPTATPDIPADNDIEAAKAAISAEEPAVGSVIDAVEAGDAASLVDSLHFESQTCQPTGSRDPSIPPCEALGLPEGSSVQLFPENHSSYQVWRDRVAVETALTALLEGGTPRVDLIALRDDGHIILSFAVDSTQGGLDSGAAGLSLEIDTEQASPVVAFRLGSTTFQLLRFEEENLGRSFEVRGVSEEIIAFENAIHELDQRCRQTPPGEDNEECGGG